MSVMLDDSKLDDWLPTYPLGDKKNIWSREIPTDPEVPLPYVISSTFQGGSPTSSWAAKQIVAYDLQRRIRMYDWMENDERDIERIAHRIRELYHENEFSVNRDWVLTNIQAEWPVNAPTQSEDVRGRMVTVRFNITED